MSIVFALLLDLFLKKGFRDIKGHFISIQLDDRWRVAVNGKPEEHEKVPPFHFLVECNDMPVTLIGPRGGGPLIGISEAGLIAALKRFGAELLPDEPAPPEMQQQGLPGVGK